jgi:hypothetical protein
MKYNCCLTSLFFAGMAGLLHSASAAVTTAVKATAFLDSIGANSAISGRGEKLQGDIPLQDLVDLHTQAGVKFSWGLGSGGTDIPKLIHSAKQVASAYSPAKTLAFRRVSTSKMPLD